MVAERKSAGTGGPEIGKGAAYGFNCRAEHFLTVVRAQVFDPIGGSIDCWNTGIT